MGEIIIALTFRRCPHNLDDQNKQGHAYHKSAEHQVQLRNAPDRYASAHDGEITVDHLFLGGNGHLDGVDHFRQHPKHQQAQQRRQHESTEPSLRSHTPSCWAPLSMVDLLFLHSSTLSIPAPCHVAPCP